MSSSAYARVRGFWLLCALAATVGYALAQQTVITEPSRPGNLEKVPRVPGMSSLTRGVNAGITYAGVHNSTIGWYDVMVPAVSYSFSERYSVDASATIYLHRLVQTMDLSTLPSQRLVLDVGDSGDTVIGLHGSFHPKMFDDLATVSLTVPTGNRTNGLGTGRVTFDFNNRMERFFGRKGVHLDLGIGDSAAVANSLLIRDYNTLGALAHFEAGAAIWLKRYGFVQASAYEQFPIGDQKVYQMVPFGSDTSGSDSSQATEVLISRGLSEDNGLTASFGIPVTSHLLFSGYYNRSLRQHQDTVSFGMTFVVRSLPGRRRLSMIDRALREAAGLSPDSQ